MDLLGFRDTPGGPTARRVRPVGPAPYSVAGAPIAARPDQVPPSAAGESDLVGRVRALETENDVLRGELERMRGRVRALLAERAWSHPGPTEADLAQEGAMAREFRAVVDQQIQALARQCAPWSPRTQRYAAHRRVPSLVRILSEAFFGWASAPEPLQLARDLGAEHHAGTIQTIKSVSSAVDEVRRKAARCRSQIVWDFDHTRSAPLEQTRQEAWPPCEPGGRVRFLVAPACRAEGRILTRQYVFTEFGYE